ncbi:WhiB family transcriptional regulator [Mycobacteroides salmoniphilum]|uniref:WhiB family transcriptional regulator n=1 Tax=Mycobacteroides salmoniphilum TaxID=404941 RepID=UPI0009947608|nr:WhiB family transcriptional regulator [Mycobacteroides salmoniphilum]
MKWLEWARCRGMPIDLFFSPDHERGRARTLREARAKQICWHCPVREPCGRYAVAAGEWFGVWGATTPRERRDRNRVSPRKRALDVVRNTE